MGTAANPAPRTVSNRTMGKLAAAALLCAAAATAVASQARVEPKQPKEVLKLDVSRKMMLESGEARALDMGASAGAQSITVEFTSTKCPISVYIFKEADAKGDDGLLTSDPQKALAGARAFAGTIKTEVPEKTPFRVILRGAAVGTDVELRIANQLAPNPLETRIKKLEEENAGLKKDLDELQKLLKKSLKEPIRKK